MLIKLGESISIRPEDIHPIEKLAGDSDLDIENRMYKFAQELKVIAPQAKDFLYFTCVMMHAAEAACINPDGSPKKLANGEVVSAHWEDVGDGVKWICNDPNIKPYKNNNCLVPGTDILMGDGGRKAIEDVVVGDEVITHNGRIRKVTQVFRHENDSKIYNLKVKGSSAISMTSEHPVFSMAGEDVRKKSIAEIRKVKDEFSWNKVHDIAPGDVIASPILDIVVESDLTPGQARLLGLFAAEGCFSKKHGKRQSASFTFGYHEKKIIELVKSIVEEEFPECSLQIREIPLRGVTAVTLTGYGIPEWFFYHIGEYSHEKRLSKELVFGSKEVKRQFLLGWLEGDGCITQGNKLVGISTSPHIAWQSWLMLKSIGVSTSIRKITTAKKLIQINKQYKEYPCRDHYRIEVYGANAQVVCGDDSVKYVLEDLAHKDFNYTFGNYTLQRVREVEVADYQGPVYNIEVEDDHSYIANGLVVHNSDSFPRLELKKAYKGWVGRPLCLDHQSQSVDKIRGVIVDTVYDDKRDRIIALCALDSKNYPDLADKVKTGVATNVSMGVAVGRAVCSECHKAARTEKEFCQHMRNKTRYAEINLDLSPLELSLVVAGADPGAKVKHIIASDVARAAELLSGYLQLKAEAKNVSTQDLESIKKDLIGLTKRVGELTSEETGKDDESDAVGPTRSRWSMGLDSSNESSTQLNVPEAFPTYASELQRAILGAHTKLASLQENLIRLSTRNEEPTMTQKNAYFLGTEEPTPGQKQYPVDPLNEKARLLDKNLQGPPPFPGVGDVEGSYPGDEKTKKDLQRLADEHERAMFRESALKKAREQLIAKGYMLGTEEPKPGQTTYSPDPLNEKARMQDKQMVGAPPFPGVGDVEGLFGDDMATKEKLSRASLRARFEKVAQPDGRINKSASRWVVFADNKPILAATVDQITKGNSDALYDAIATERFGKSLLSRIQTEGFHATASTLLKQAQPVPAAPAPAPAAPPAAPALPPAGDLEPPEDVGGEAGDPNKIVDDLEDLIDEMDQKLSDLRDKVSGPVAEDAEALEGVPPAGDEAFVDGAAPKSASQLQGMRKRVNGMLQEGISELTPVLAKHIRELRTAQSVYKEAYASMNDKQRNYLNELTISAVKDAKVRLADTRKLMEAVVKYAYGTAEIEKRAQAQAKISKKADMAIREALGLDPREEEEFKPYKDPEDLDIEEILAGIDDEEPEFVGEDIEIGPVTEEEEEEEEEDKDNSTFTTADGEKITLGPKALEGGTLSLDSLGSKEDRANARIKLAQKGLLGFNELSNMAHPGGSVSAVQAGNLDVKPTVPGAAFHVPKDLKDAMLELANMPPKVRKQAEMIHQLVSEGKMQASDVDQLVAHGIDADAVKYYKTYWGQAKDPQATEFASKLTQEHANAKKAEEMEGYKGTVKRAYDMANQMVAKGLISEAQVTSQVEDIMKWNDAGFESFKTILARQPSINKQASVPVVGLLDSGAVILPSFTEKTGSEHDIKAVFDGFFANKRY